MPHRSNNPKITKAKKMMTKMEKMMKIPPFKCQAWQDKKATIQEKILTKKILKEKK